MILKDRVLEILRDEFKIHPLKVLNIYLYGSRCYGTYNENSDYDFTIIAKNSVENIELNYEDFNFHIQTPDYFRERLYWNDPKSFECLLWSKDNLILEKEPFSMYIETPKFRHSVSHISSNSWVKARKKIIQNDIYIGQKSLFHSLRIPMYATQIMINNHIHDWECANHYWEDIKKISDWKVLKDKYSVIRNQILSDFRKLCPKDEI